MQGDLILFSKLVDSINFQDEMFKLGIPLLSDARQVGSSSSFTRHRRSR